MADISSVSSEAGSLLTAHGEPPDLLHHYTTAAGMLGILESGELWASHARFLNDPTEVDFAGQLVAEAIDAKLTERETEPRKGLIDLAREWWVTTKLRTGKDWVRFMEESGSFYVTCFCEEGDLLSQWRGYAAGVGGFALGFRAAALTSDEIRLIKVVYDQDEQQEHIDNLVDRMGAIGAGPALQDLFWLHVSLKHPAFAEEDEWRLITFRSDSSDVRVRPADEFLVPYVPLRPGRMDNAQTDHGEATGIHAQNDRTTAHPEAAPARGDDTPVLADDAPEAQTREAKAEGNERALPLEEITIGPTPNPMLAEKAVRIALSTNGYERSVKILHSEIPLRKT